MDGRKTDVAVRPNPEAWTDRSICQIEIVPVERTRFLPTAPARAPQFSSGSLDAGKSVVRVRRFTHGRNTISITGTAAHR
jgi:hypothetical protein